MNAPRALAPLDIATQGAAGARASASSAWTAAVVLAIAAYAAYFGFYCSLFHLTFGTTAYDLGTVDQGIWLAGHSSDLFVTVRGLPLLGDHVRPIAFLLAPLYWIWDDVLALILLQTVVIAAGAWVLYLIARRELASSPLVAVVVSVSYLLNPFVQNLNLDHVHPDAFASTFLLSSIYFLRTARHAAFWVTALLAMACKEDVPLVYVVLGMTLLWGRQRRLGAALVLVSGVYFAACVGWILPHFNGVGFFRAKRFVPDASGQSFVSALFDRLVNAESGRYLLALGLPLGFVSLLAPVTLAPGLPQVLANLLSTVWYPRSPAYHYATSIVPCLYVAAIDAVGKLDGRRLVASADLSAEARGAASDPRVLRRAGFVALACALATCVVMSNLRYAKVPLTDLTKIRAVWRTYTGNPANAEIHAALGRIPTDAAVSADYTLVPHLAHRRLIYMFPNPFMTQLWGVRSERPHDPAVIDYIVVRTQVMREKQERIIDPLVAAGTFVRVGDEKAVRIYRRADH